jgi:hypothetical protein
MHRQKLGQSLALSSWQVSTCKGLQSVCRCHYVKLPLSRGSGVNQSSSTLVNAAQRNLHVMEVVNVDQPHWPLRLTVKGGKTSKMLTATSLFSILLSSDLKGEENRHSRLAREVPDNPCIAVLNANKNNSQQSFRVRRRGSSCQATAKQTAKGHPHRRRDIEYVDVHAWQVGVLYKMDSASQDNAQRIGWFARLYYPCLSFVDLLGLQSCNARIKNCRFPVLTPKGSSRCSFLIKDLRSLMWH